MSGVIKSANAALRAGTGLTPPEALLRELHDESDPTGRGLSRAQQQAQIIISTACAEADAIREQAHSEGYKAGIAEAAAAAGSLIERLEADLAQLAEERANLMQTAEADLLKLCTQIVEKILRHEIRTDPRVVERTIRSCLRRVRDRGEVFVRVSPDELETAKSLRDELLSAAEGVQNIALVDDRRVSPGGCVVEAPSGDMDARIETQIGEVESKLTETLENDRGETDDRSDEIPGGDQPD